MNDTNKADIGSVLANLRQQDTETQDNKKLPSLAERGHNENELLYMNASVDKTRQQELLAEIRNRMTDLDTKRIKLAKDLNDLQNESLKLDSTEHELRLQEGECIDRIEHYTHQMAQAETLNLRRTQR